MGRRPGGLCFVVAAVWLVAAGCSGGSAGAPGEIVVNLHDFRLDLSTQSAPSGDVRLRLDNDGPSTHEFNVDRTDLSAESLPLRTDGLSVDEKSPTLTRIDSVEVLEAGDRVHFKVNLPPGHYVLYCNLEGHYLGHMYATLDVH